MVLYHLMRHNKKLRIKKPCKNPKCHNKTSNISGCCDSYCKEVYKFYRELNEISSPLK